MADLLNIPANELPIGSIIDCVGAPNANWKKCNGQVLAQVDYPAYVSLGFDLHPMMWGSKSWEYIVVNASSVNNRYCVTNIGNNVCIVGVGNEVWTSSDGGETWSTNTNLPATGSWQCMVNDGSRIVALQYNSLTGAYSDTYGASWTSFTIPATVSDNFDKLAYNGSYFIGMDSSYHSGGYYAYSSDGATWTAKSYPWTGYVYGMGASDTYFLVIGEVSGQGGYGIAVSSDGENWTTSSDEWWFHNPSWEFADPTRIFYLNGKWFIISTGTNTFRYWLNESADPSNVADWREIHWKPKNLNYYVNTTHMLWTGTHYVVFNESGSDDGILTSLDGENWQYVRVPFSYNRYAANNGDNWIVTVDRSNVDTAIIRSEGTYYNKSTHFQLPHFTGLPAAGMYKYIRVK